MIATAIITAPRPRPTLAKSLRSYRAAGFDGLVHVFAEPGSETVGGGDVNMIYNANRRGNLRNWIQALRYLIDKTDADWMMVCEDDLTWAPAAFYTLLNDRIAVTNETGMLSLYCPVKMSRLLETQYSPGRKLNDGWYSIKIGRKLWGAQCLTLPRREAIALLDCAYLTKVLTDPTRDKNVDLHVAESMFLRDREIRYRIPCLVHHDLGDHGNSSLQYPDRDDLRTHYYRGA